MVPAAVWLLVADRTAAAAAFAHARSRALAQGGGRAMAAPAPSPWHRPAEGGGHRPLASDRPVGRHGSGVASPAPRPRAQLRLWTREPIRRCDDARAEPIRQPGPRSAEPVAAGPLWWHPRCVLAAGQGAPG